MSLGRLRQKAVASLNELHVADVDPAVDEAYERELFGSGWTDMDGDGQDTRAEVLIRYHLKSKAPLTFHSEQERRVEFGYWRCRFTGETFTDAGDLDIDHIVPLKNAWVSGASEWTLKRREQYSNGYGIKGRRQRSWLVPVCASANRSKGSRSPDEWMPDNVNYQVRYARLWIRTKKHWKLSVTPAEKEALLKVLTG